MTERKVKPDGRVQEFSCALLHLGPGLAVVRFVLTKGGSVFNAPVSIPPGSVSDGYFWTKRPFSLYRMRDPEGGLIAHRFEAVADVQIGRDVVSFRDLVLDWWALPDGTLIEEDAEELEELLGAGVVSADDAAAARSGAQQVYSRYRHVIDELETLERTVGAASIQLR